MTPDVPLGTDLIIYMQTVPGQPKLRELSAPLPLGDKDDDGWVPKRFRWDGSSVPWIFRGFFPRHWHPIASCRHDWRCKCAKNKEERKFADEKFKQDVAKTSWTITAVVAYFGVRVGAAFGAGVRY